MIRVALVGCGNIGAELARSLQGDRRFKVVAIADRDPLRVKILLKKLPFKPRVVTLANAVKSAELIVEAAGPDAVQEILNCRHLDKKGKHLVAMSSGGLVRSLPAVNKIRHCRIHVPSGAVAGLDALRAVSGNISSLTLTTTKPPASFAGAPYVKRKKLRLAALPSAKKIFDGGFNEALRGFPQNINVAASLFLASHFKKIKVRIVADPDTRFNSHEIRCKGSFGEISATTRCLPGKNPKTSVLALLSAIAAVKNMEETIYAGS